MARARLPFTVIGGFLGAGKTTLLNHWLRHADGKRIAVLVNDFGALNVDAALIESNHGDVIALTNGCVCCQIGDDLSLALMNLLDKGTPLDAVVVEASGVSDPWRIAQLGRADPRLQLDAVVVLVDAGAALDQARDPLLADTLQRQLKMADLVVVNKADLTSADHLAALHAWLGEPGRCAQVIEAVNAAVPPALLSAAMGPGQAADTAHRDAAADPGGAAQAGATEPYLAEFRRISADHGAQFEAWSCREVRSLTAAELRAWLRSPPRGLLRLKGWLPAVEENGERVSFEVQFAGRLATVRRADNDFNSALLVAIGLRGRLPTGELMSFFIQEQDMAARRSDSNEIRITRIYDAPVRAVWDAWTDPDQVGKWWGPRGFTLTTHSKDLRAGGSWRYTMHGPDGVDWPNVTCYHVVEPLRRLVYDHGGTDDRPPLFRVTALFIETAGKTTLDLCFTLPTPEAAAETARFIKQAGGNATWDRLAEHLEETSTGRRLFVINRTLDAPLARIYDMWTKPEHLARWLPPVGTHMHFLRSDIAVGKSTLFVITGSHGTMHVRAEYLALEPPQRIVYTQQFVDAQERPAAAPGADVWPATLLTTVTFAAEGPDQTRVTLTCEAHAEATPAEMAAFVAERPGMTLGWSGSFDALEALLEVD